MAAAYSASKAAVIALTKAVGKDFARTGVVNCVAPAVIETAMLGDMSQEHVDYMVEKIPMGRMGDADEVAALICWLASEECSFSTGATYDISGGRAVVLMRQRPFRSGDGSSGDGASDATSGRGGRASVRRASTSARSLCRPTLAPRPAGGVVRRASPTSAAATRGSRSRAATSTRSSTTPTGPSSSSRTRAAVARSGRTSRSRSAPTATWNVPEPEIGARPRREPRDRRLHRSATTSRRATSRAQIPLYLPQAKVFAAACAIGPAVYVPEDWEAPLEISLTIRDADGPVLFAGETSTGADEADVRRPRLAGSIRDNPVPPGSVLLTGTGLVPPDDFTLAAGSRGRDPRSRDRHADEPRRARRRPAREELPLTEIPFQDTPRG